MTDATTNAIPLSLKASGRKKSDSGAGAVAHFRGLKAWVGAFYAFLYFPILVLIIYSFNESRFAMLWKGFGVSWYAKAIGNDDIRASALNSLVVALSATAVSVSIAVAAALARSGEFRGKTASTGLMALPIIVPEIVTAVATLMFFSSIGLALGMANAMAEELHLYNWTDYTDAAAIEKYEKETGIQVIVDTFDSNETLLAKLKAGATGYDIVFPSQHFVEIMINEGLLQKIDVKGLPNYANVDPRWKNPEWDPEQAYSAPWHWGSASFSYRSDLYSGKGETLKEFFEPSEQVTGRLQVFKSPDEVFNLANLYLDLPFCSEDPEHAKAVLALLETQKGAVLTYSSEAMNDRLANGEAVMAAHWNGYSLVGRMEGNENIVYAYPKEGVVGWFDSMVVPVGAQNVDAALKFMDFMMDPENIAMQTNFTAYSNAIVGSESYFAEHLVGAPEMNAPEGIPVKFGKACSPKAQKLIDRVWTKLLQ